MSPAPTSRHQMIVSDLFGQLYQHFQGRPCRPLVSPIDVKLSAEDVVQPDIVVICDPSTILETHVEGPPPLVIEVLSPSSNRHDRVRKLRLYARFGVQEYWLVQPHPALIEVLRLTDGDYRIAGTYTDTERLRSPTFPELALDLTTVFTLPVPASEQIDEIRESAPPYGARTTGEIDMRRSFTMEYWQDDGWYVGRLKEVPGVFSQGETLDELEENIRDAYDLVLSDVAPAPIPAAAHSKPIQVEV